MSSAMGDPADSVGRRAQRVLSMVGELHKLGYQRLRVSPGMSPSGLHWRCSITPVENVLKSHGALIARHEDELVASYTTAAGDDYFGWADARSATARRLARLFIERFPRIVARSAGEDWLYAGWFVQILGVAESGHLPIAYSDDWDGSAAMVMNTVSPDGKAGSPVVPLPPPGVAEAEGLG